VEIALKASEGFQASRIWPEWSLPLRPLFSQRVLSPNAGARQTTALFLNPKKLSLTFKFSASLHAYQSEGRKVMALANGNQR